MKERRDLITIYKLMNNLEETDREDLIMVWKGKASYLRGHKKSMQKEMCLNDTEIQAFPREV